VLTHFTQDIILVISDIFENISQNSGNIEKYLTESCSRGANNKFYLNLFELVSVAQNLMNKFKEN